MAKTYNLDPTHMALAFCASRPFMGSVIFGATNSSQLEKILDDYKIVDIYDLSKKVLNKKKNPVYNNFLEKITCREQNKVNYILCDNKNCYEN